ncbi:hypothetical protein PaeBR_10555 [Paenibacillus sp. BR2-3]|uniref:hypothetical protein n=1 Tax=Paenibacillus sp. BR2-3 TaxID=3048494 RepID=UPI003977E366
MPGGIDALGVDVDHDFGEHFGMVAIAAAAGVGCVKDGIVQSIYGGVNDTNEVMGWKIFF